MALYLMLLSSAREGVGEEGMTSREHVRCGDASLREPCNLLLFFAVQSYENVRDNT